MRFGLDVSQHQLDWHEILRRTRRAEDAGFDGAWVFDHFKPLYGDPAGPCFEGWTLLAALAAATSRIRLGALVTGVTYRHPSVLAAEAVTVDHVSGGRLEFGIGAAWFDREHIELGIPFPRTPERIERLEEAIAVARALWTTDGATFEGRHYTLAGATYGPRPVQQPHPPVWVGGSGARRMLPLIGRIADAWHTYGPPEAVEQKWAIVREHAERAGRDPASILRAAQLSLSEPWDDVRRAIDGHRASGVEYLTVGWPSEGEARLDEFVERVLPDYRA